MNPSLVDRLEREASSNPRRYRIRLTALAVAGDLALTAVQIAPVFAIIFFGAVIANYAFFYWVAAAATGFFVWVMRPSFRPEGRELQRKDAPELFSALDTLRAKLRVPRRMDVRIDDAFNASAAESLGLLGLIGTRRVLTLGVPLLATLNRDELIAVIAHEFGHFSRHHGRFGHWLYRARVGWSRYAAYVRDSESPLQRAAVRYAAWFLPYFSVRSFVHSRSCEYEADKDGALAVGAELFAGALTRIGLTSQFEESMFGASVGAWQDRSHLPPADFHQRFAQAARAATVGKFQALLQASLGERSGWSETHPSLSDRLAALNQAPRLAPAGICAGEALLGTLWPTILARANAQWARENAVDWALEHFRRKHMTRSLTEPERSVAGSWPLVAR